MAMHIYWFSGTGNSWSVAERLADQLDSDTVEVRAMVEAQATAPENVDRLVLVFPVYAFGLPAAVAEFARALAVRADLPVYSVATCAGMPGKAHAELRRTLRRNGNRLCGGWTVKMPENYPVMAEPGSYEENRQRYTAAYARLKQISAVIDKGEGGPFEDSSGPIGWFSPLVHAVARRFFPKMDKKFHVESQCTACATCEKVCPVGNISMENNRPVWHHRCEQCFACLQWCPVEAIQWGKRTQGKQRYHHPDFAAKDFFLNDA